ncbi:YhgE/Pip domain-containing protein [Sporosarcina aquimarina]|uniref:ABC transporter permease n=1 Tax=Sporosarcina aquimarina TaxID=114975 RepID=A0ABU4G0F9_9BACL|nr:ABC transporter permease [Sporosarcina aquimarina]MDW0109793.1 ABC transporter permease [Sporosarcina aquimarina]
MKFTHFLKTRGSIAAIVMGVFYAIAMLGIFLPGYTAIPGNIDKLPIAIVNDDAGDYGVKIAEQLQENLPFKEIETDIQNKQALKDLEKNDLALVVHIPESFSWDMQNGDISSSIDFTINDAGATVISSSMKSVVTEINNQLSEQFSQQTAQSVLMNVNVPEKQAAELAEKIETAYAGNVVTINKIPDGMHNNMLPMFLTMASYIGAMIGSMQLVEAFKENRGKASRTRLFIFLQLTALLIAVLSSLAATGITYLVNQPDGSLFLSIVGHQTLIYMASFNFTAILIFLLGPAGMILNIPLIFVQTLANGAVISLDMMYAPYEWASHVTPMYYSVQGYIADLYGSISPSPFLWSLALIGLVAMVINIIIVGTVHKSKTFDKSQTKSQIEEITKVLS